MDDEAAAAVEDGAEEEKGTGDVEVTDIDVPMLVRLEGLDKAGAFFRRPGRLPGQQSRVFQDAIDAGRAASNLVGIEHHEGQPPVAFARMAAGEGANAFFLVVAEPVIARDPGVVLVDFAETLNPVVILAGADADPGQEPRGRDLGFVRPGADKIDKLVARVVGNPATF